MSDDAKIRGPASYFPSIEKHCGHPIAHWMELLDAMAGKPHMEMVAALKSAHEIGHGHANALVAHHRAQGLS
ncbi:MAG: DUF4287 domain-containing protein [Rubrivivax sp.]